MNITNEDVNLIISILAALVALTALWISVKATIYQIISLLNAQLTEKAKECNNNLDQKDLSRFPSKVDKVSWILSTIITAEEILNFHFSKKHKCFSRIINRQSLIDHFYLQLHTTIRVFLKNDEINVNEIEDGEHFEKDLKLQFKRSTEFLKIYIARDELKCFEKRHDLSLKKNKKYVNDICDE